MKPKILFLFSGQGSHYPGMGRELYEQHPVFRSHFDRCAALAEANCGIQIQRWVWGARRETHPDFDRVSESSPALFAINSAIATTLVAEGLHPDLLLGYSLGEMVAASFGGYSELDAMLRYVVDFAALVERETPRATMVAVLDSLEQVQEACRRSQGVSIASHNFDGCFVLVGEPGQMKQVIAWLTTRNVVTQVLPVSRGFHSPLVDPVRERFVNLDAQVGTREHFTPLWSATYHRLLEAHDLTGPYFWNVVRRPVQFRETIERIDREAGPFHYIDVGPSGTLATFVKYILGPSSRSRVWSVLDPFGNNLSALKRVLQATGCG